MPIVLADGDHSIGPVSRLIADALQAHGCTKVIVATINDSGHWVVDEQPDAVAALIEENAQ